MTRRGIGSARGLLPATLSCLAFAACEVGDGSDIGPKLPKIPDASCRVVVLDDQGRGVVGATVTIGTNVRATTGRNGRGDFLANPRGRLLVAVDAADGAAVSGDTLGSCQVAATVVGPDLPAVLFVPELPATATAVLTAGTQAATTTIVSMAGANLAVPAGASVGASGGGATVTVRLGDLQPQHLPGDLPAAPTGAWLFGRGLWIDPVGASFTPGASLDVPDDLGLGSGSAQLFHLDPATGEWGQVAVAATAAGGRIVATGAVAAGGLYVFAAAVVDCVVSGRVLDAAIPAAGVPDTMVVVDQWKTITDGNGRFVVSGVPATTADGSPRAAAIELFSGGTWLPVRRVTTAPVVPGTLDVGDLVLDTLLAGNIRVQQVFEGRGQAWRRARISSGRGDVALTATGDSNGQVLFEDVPADYFGFQDGRAFDGNEVAYGQAIGFLERGRRWLDAYQFTYRRTWYLGGRNSRTLVSDTVGGGPIEGASIVQGVVPGQGFVGTTLEGGTIFVTRDFAGRATATFRSARDGRVIVHAFSIDIPNGEHLELPLQRVLRTPLGAFDRHGLVEGSLLGADPAQQHELRASRRLSLQELWESIAEDGPALSSLPVDIDPAVTHDAFVAGLPVAGGHLAAIEYGSPGGLKTLAKLGVVADFVPTEARRVASDVTLAAAATDAFVVPGALAGAPPELDVSQLSLALLLQQPSGRVVDVARGLRGNHAVVGNDLVFTLPPLVGDLADHGWVALLDGSYPSNGSTLRCSAVISLPRPSALPSYPRGAFAFGGFPQVLSPADGATVPASGFTVQFTLPPDTLHGTVELRSVVGGETLLWQALMRPQQGQFVFVTLPPNVATPLVAGRTWSLTVSAYSGDGPVTGSLDPYRDLTTFLQSIGAIERGAYRVTRRTIQVTTN